MVHCDQEQQLEHGAQLKLGLELEDRPEDGLGNEHDYACEDHEVVFVLTRLLRIDSQLFQPML